tara:strand:- start:196 stop:399 length:204 start_codon:yes stop_codon:yes gene_type:complete
MNWIKKLFKGKSRMEVLADKYDSLMEESYKLSKVNRTKSDEKTFEANEVLIKIKELEEELYNKDRNL